MLRNIMMGLALVAGASMSLPSAAIAKDHGHKHGHGRGHGNKHWHQGGHGGYPGGGYGGASYYGGGYAEPPHYYAAPRNCRKTGGTTGLILGGVAGALLGREIDTRGERTTGTILGSGAGALLGRELTRKRRC